MTTMQFSTKIFSQADINSPKQLKASLLALLAHPSDCLVLAYTKADVDALRGSKAKTGLLTELDRILGGSVTHANLVGDLETQQASVCSLRAEKSWATAGVKAKRVLLACLGDINLAEARSLNAFSKIARSALKHLSGG
ncbi:MAG: leucyl aminopeptidase, partial [Polynucleobacter sp. 24-46-87]